MLSDLIILARTVEVTLPRGCEWGPWGIAYAAARGGANDSYAHSLVRDLYGFMMSDGHRWHDEVDVPLGALAACPSDETRRAMLRTAQEMTCRAAMHAAVASTFH